MTQFYRFLILGIVMAGCSDPLPEQDPDQPVISDVSTYAVVVGETIEFYGANFSKDSEDDQIKLRFEGTFRSLDGSEQPVDLWVTPSINKEAGEDGRDILTWRRVGPFTNPFTNSATVGQFVGYVTAVRQQQSGDWSSSEPRPFELDVEPSIIIESFQPIDADCTAPAARILAGHAYQMSVRVAGFAATKFIYEISEIRATDGISTIIHDYEGQVVDSDGIGEREAVIFNPIADDTQFYVAGIRIIAEDADGRRIETALPVSVHRPIEV
ncbi:MAG: hypothetical protein ACPGQS_09825, partial [Bradymonadia bacterium]